MPTRKNFDWLVSEIEAVKRLASASSAPQLANSSFDSAPGASIDEVNPETGNAVAAFGTQFDGSHGSIVFTGPNPQKPSPAVYDVGPGILAAGWDGIFCNADGVPDILETAYMDFTHVEVHVSADPDHDPLTADALVGTINTVRGGRVSFPATGTMYVWLVARSLAGKRSAPSDVVSVEVPPGAGDTTALEEELDAANERIDNAEELINQANLKFTVSDTVPAGLGGVNGAVWWRKDSTGIIGQWVWDSATAEWVPKGLAVTQLIPGGTMSSALVDQLFADVVITNMAIADAFIGSNAILSGAVTATHITASEELSAKVASFLEVTAGMINVEDLWADSAWITEAQTLILSVLEHTNGEGYTSTVTGKGLLVTRTIGGQTFEVIRLGTFGQDFLNISDGDGNAMATITAKGEMAATSHYVAGDVFSGGRLLGEMEGPRGEVTYGEVTYGTSTALVISDYTNGAGVLEVSFEAERGRAYRMDARAQYFILGGYPERVAMRSVYRTGNAVPTNSVFDGTVGPVFWDETDDITRVEWARTHNYGGRFIPFPHTAAGTARTTRVRVLMLLKRLVGPVNTTIRVQFASMTVYDMGVPGVYQSHGGLNNAAGSSTLTSVSTVTTTYRQGTTGGGYVGGLTASRFRRAVASSANVWANVTSTDGLTNQIYTGLSPDGAYEYRATLNFPTAFFDEIRQGVALLGIDKLRLIFKPQFFKAGMGAVRVGLVTSQPSTGGLVFPQDTFYPDETLDLGAWPQGTGRTIELPRDMIELIRSTPNKALSFGFNQLKPDYSDPHYTMYSPADLADCFVQVVYRKAV